MRLSLDSLADTGGVVDGAAHVGILSLMESETCPSILVSDIKPADFVRTALD